MINAGCDVKILCDSFSLLAAAVGVGEIVSGRGERKDIGRDTQGQVITIQMEKSESPQKKAAWIPVPLHLKALKSNCKVIIGFCLFFSDLIPFSW